MTKTNFRQVLGCEGERRAALFLEARGYRIIARNVRADRVEIDLIVGRGATLVFVEVKSRRAPHASSLEVGPHGGLHEGHSLAAEAVDDRKQRRLRRGAHAWLNANPEQARGSRRRRFDVVTCLFDGMGETQNKTTAPGSARWSIEHWESAF
ncbi:MAG TPA: YraN family protein [Myxococcales bacterium]|nr:YraN family protein [Myxococcales bacterium]HIK86636.1 YraN family protein [Myxococcales bacterium]